MAERWNKHCLKVDFKSFKKIASKNAVSVSRPYAHLHHFASLQANCFQMQIIAKK